MQPRRRVRDFVDAGVAENADEVQSRRSRDDFLRAFRRNFPRRVLRENQPAEERSRVARGAGVFRARQAADFVFAEDQRPAGAVEIAFPHQRGADEKRVGERRAGERVRVRAQSRFGDAHGVPADGAGKFPRARNVGAQRAQIAVVDADDARAEPIRAAHAVRRVRFGEHAHVHRARRAGKAQIRFVVEHGKHQ